MTSGHRARTVSLGIDIGKNLYSSQIVNNKSDKVIKFINFVKSAVDADNSGTMQRNDLNVFPISGYRFY